MILDYLHVDYLYEILYIMELDNFGYLILYVMGYYF